VQTFGNFSDLLTMLTAATPTPITPFLLVAPVMAALLFIGLCSLLPEPHRQRFSALLVAAAGAIYPAGGFGLGEVAFAMLFLALAYLGQDNYRWIGAGWMLHAAWDLAHDLWGNPILPYVPESSIACLVYDPVVAAWYLIGAPTPWHNRRAAE